MVTWDQTNASTCLPSVLTVNSSSCSNVPTYFIAVALSINMFLGLPANAFVLWLSVKEMIQGQSNEIFFFNAALSEVFFCITYVFIIQYYLFDCTYCIIGMYFPGIVLLVGRSLFQSCICVERYVAVLHPVTFLKLKPMKYRISFSVFGWILVIGSSLIVSVSISQLYKLLLAELVGFLCIKVFSCLMVLKALKRPGPGESINKKEAVNQEKLKAFQIIRVVLVTAVFMHGPMIISLVLYYFTDAERFYLIWSVASCLGLTSGFVQPLLYLRRLGKLSFCHSNL